MDASPVGVESAWSTLRMSAVQQAASIAVMKQQAKAQVAVLDMVQEAGERRAPPAPSGQGERVDRRV
jgi:hypothetical protein